MKPQKIFQGLQGIWTLSRILFHSESKYSFLGRVQGIATFTPFNENEIQYNENGKFINDRNQIFEIMAEYRYTYDKKEGRIDKFFSQDNKKTHHFYTLKIENPKNNKEIKATGEHLCSNDNYQAIYRFCDGDDFNKFSLIYRVKGPKKNYISETIFELLY